jgi:predicted amidophosphoribosyltransferase
VLIRYAPPGSLARMPAPAAARAPLAALLALVVPPRCAACAGPVAATGPPVCPGCLSALPWLRGTRCRWCAMPRHRGGQCPAAGAPWAIAWSPLAYEGTARALVGALKFGARLRVADLLAAHLAANLPAELRRSRAAVVAVPPHPGRRRARGYDGAALLAAAFARRTGRPLVPCLRRRDRLAPLKRAGVRERRSGGLRIDACAQVPRSVLLLDDVHTTGATLRAAAAALAAGGAEWIAAVTYARTL